VSLIQSTIDNSHTIKNLYRLSVSPIQSNQADNINTREKRFSGKSKEKFAQYIDANSGEIIGDIDKALITEQAKDLLSEADSAILPMTLITHFGFGYDFRNKRLPVWRVEGSNGDHLFIDPITHILVDRNNSISRIEGYSFSFLHKWSMLTPITGRFNRDMLILLTLGFIFILAGLGLVMRLSNAKASKNKSRQKHASQHNNDQNKAA
jgi:hypothetical protein